MKRYIDSQLFIQFKQDFQFLFDRIKASLGELDLRLRDNYFNLYYKGNSLAKVAIKNGLYVVSIHPSFAKEVFIGDFQITTASEGGKYYSYILTKDDLRQFFQVKYVHKLASKIKEVNNGEEITFEQMLITDNLENPEVIIIDRQITETALNRRRLDLLGLKHEGGNRYSFLVLEVKLGNNPELNGLVAIQLQDYISHINLHFDDWKKNYELVYAQLFDIGIYPGLLNTRIEIVQPVAGKVIVGSYSGLAKAAIATLKKNFPAIEVKQIKLSL